MNLLAEWSPDDILTLIIILALCGGFIFIVHMWDSFCGIFKRTEIRKDTKREEDEGWDD